MERVRSGTGSASLARLVQRVWRHLRDQRVYRTKRARRLKVSRYILILRMRLWSTSGADHIGQSFDLSPGGGVSWVAGIDLLPLVVREGYL